MRVVELDKPLEVEIADDRSVSVSRVYKGNTLVIDGTTFFIDLIPIAMREIQVVVGMDWLAQHDAMIVCTQKLVRVRTPSGGELMIYVHANQKENSVCSMMKARKHLTRGGEGFLAYVVDSKAEKRSLEIADVPVVNEFLDVFQEDLPGVPPERHIEFTIDLVPRATPIARTGYRLAPPEMKELMIQLKELLDKVFIRPSTSPWGAAILFVKRKMECFGCASIIGN